MRLIFLGTGSAFTVGNGNYHSNVLLEGPTRRLLIDCGSDIRFSLYEQGFSSDDIDDIFISHLHADHVGGLEWFAFMRKFNTKRTAKPRLVLEKQIKQNLWENVLSGGLSSLEESQATLSTYFTVEDINDFKFLWDGIQIQLVQTTHIFSNHQLMPCYGLYFPLNNKKVFFTADTQYVPEKFEKYYRDADIIFHDCETNHPKSGVHAHFEELCHLKPEIKAKMWLYHYLPGELPDAQKEGFIGFVRKGQIFE